jgi:hypothetical protein
MRPALVQLLELEPVAVQELELVPELEPVAVQELGLVPGLEPVAVQELEPAPEPGPLLSALVHRQKENSFHFDHQRTTSCHCFLEPPELSA